MNWTKIGLLTLPLFMSCQQAKPQQEPEATSTKQIEVKETPSSNSSQYSLSDFYGASTELDSKVASYFDQLSEKEKIAQMIITCAGELGKPKATVRNLVQSNSVGGVIFLKGNKEDHKAFIQELNQLQEERIPLLYSIDAEPSLYNKRVIGTSLDIKKTIDIESESECEAIAHTIDQELLEMGFRQNFAPVVDLSPNNEAIKNRSHGSDPERVINMAKAFVKATQEDQIIATAKHFPGHGYVKGDTHKQSVYIDGELKEVDVYKPLIDAGVLSIMVGHITIKNNEKYSTDGLPATCSKTIVTDLLKNEMNFQGIVITDAMNIMKAVTQVENSPLLAAKAGCDMILMPPNEKQLLNDIHSEYTASDSFKNQIDESVKKIIRLKICLGLL